MSIQVNTALHTTLAEKPIKVTSILYYYNVHLQNSVLVSASYETGELGDVGDGGRLRCLHGKVDTAISCMCTCTVGSAQCSGCVVYDPSAVRSMAAI